jgi:hypothetical protein
MMLHRSKEHDMFPFVMWPRKSSQAGHSRNRRPKRAHSARLVLEGLEDRLVLSVNPTGDLAQIPYVSPSGPTLLGLNFDGENFYTQGGFLGIGAQSINIGSYGIGNAAATDQNMQDILFRVSEIYAPFNIEVTRLHGGNTYFSNNGNSTVFVGNSYGDINVGAGSTPDGYTDYPSVSIFPHPRNGDTYDLAFVDPFQNNNGAVPDVATAIAHEAGHTFGLAHVRTDGRSDPAALGSGTIPDVMSYNRFIGLEYFKDQSLPLTAWNQTSSGLQLSAALPVYVTYRPTTQDSYYCLGQVLGYRSDPIDNHPHVADAGAIDPQYTGQYVHANSDDMDSADSIIPEQGTITRLGDYDVYRWTAPASETINISLLGQNGLSPLLLVYDNTGQLVSVQDSVGRPGQSQAGSASTAAVNVTGGTSYYFVVGAQDSDSTGSYQFTINQLPNWAQLSGTALSINGNQLGAATEALSIDSTPKGKLVVALNNLPQKVQFEAGQVTAINVNSLGSNNTINISNGAQNLSPLPPQISINVAGNTNLYLNDGLNAAVTVYTGTATGLMRAAFGAPSHTINYGQLSSVTVAGGTGNDTFTVQSTPAGTAVNFTTGKGTNEVDLGSSSSPVAITDHGTATIIVGTAQKLDGIAPVAVYGDGNTALTVNDQANPTSSALLHKPFTQYTVTGGGLTRTVSFPSPLPGGGGSTTTTAINYQGLTTLTLNAGNNGPNAVDVEGTPAGTTNVKGGAATSQINVEGTSAGTTNVSGGAVTTQINVTPTAQNLDGIAGPLIVSGLGSLNVYDQADLHGAISGAPIGYDVYSGVTRSVPYAKGATPTTTHIFAFSFQGSLTLYTSSHSPNQVSVSGLPAPTTTIDSGSADAITVTAFSVPVVNSLGGTQTVSNQLTVNAHGGTLTVDDRATQNDTLDIFSDAFTITDQTVVQQDHWQKVLKKINDPEDPTNPKFPPPPPGTVLNANFTYGLSYTNVTSLAIDGGPISSTFNVQSTPLNVPVTVNTSTGPRAVTGGSNGGGTVNQFVVGVNGSVKNIRSQLTLNGSGPNDTLLVDDSHATAQDNVTVTPTQVGAAATDQFFGGSGVSRGSLTYSGLPSLTLNLSHAADDTVQLSPSAATAFSINGDPTEFQAGHGAVLNLDLTGVVNALMTPSGPGAGAWTFGNRQAVTFKNLASSQAH